jgi:hypothetical protein
LGERQALSDRSLLQKNDDLPAASAIKAHMAALVKNLNHRDSAINFLIYTYGVRNQDIDCFITTRTETPIKPDTNYLIVKNTEIKWIRHVYKTASVYGSKHIIIKSPRFSRAIRAIGTGQWLLADASGRHIKSVSLSRFIPKRLFAGLSESDYFKILVRDAQLKTNPLGILQKLSKSRGTDLETVHNAYNMSK